MMSDGIHDSSDNKVDFLPVRGIIDNSLDEEDQIPPAKQIYQKMYDRMEKKQEQPSFEEEEEDDDDYGFGNRWQGKPKKETQPEFEIEDYQPEPPQKSS